jgi:hypothetical protein
VTIPQEYQTLESISNGGTEGDVWKLGHWAYDEHYFTQALMHLEYWKLRFPSVSKALTMSLGATVEDVVGDHYIYTTKITLWGPQLGTREFGTIVTAKEHKVP